MIFIFFLFTFFVNFAKSDGESCTKENTEYKIKGTDYVEYYVLNAKSSAKYLESIGFQTIAVSKQSSSSERVSYVVKQGKVKLVLTSPLKSKGKVATEINRILTVHGDFAMKTVAFKVNDARAAWEYTTSRGVESIMEPVKEEDENGYVIRSAVKGAWGIVDHVFVERKKYKGLFLPYPAFDKFDTVVKVKSVGLKYVDHMAVLVDYNRIDEVAEYYIKMFGFHEFYKLVTYSKHSIMNSRVVANHNARIKFVISETNVTSPEKGVVQAFIENYEGEGVNHIAMATGNIIETISSMRKEGMKFLQIPDAYYDLLEDRVGVIDEKLEDLKENGILVDKDEDGYLYQLFTKPLGVRKTGFFEVIQRKGATSFGEGNVKALMEAVGRDKERGK